jgi:hypothetical protein
LEIVEMTKKPIRTKPFGESGPEIEMESIEPATLKMDFETAGDYGFQYLWELDQLPSSYPRYMRGGIFWIDDVPFGMLGSVPLMVSGLEGNIWRVEFSDEFNSINRKEII